LSWATCWPVPVSRIQKSLQRSAMIPSASWAIVFEQMVRTIKKMCSHKWWLSWKISVQCVREINFFHSHITVIILHCQKLLSYNWRHYLSITPRNYHCMCDTVHFSSFITSKSNLWRIHCQSLSHHTPLFQDPDKGINVLITELNRAPGRLFSSSRPV